MGCFQSQVVGIGPQVGFIFPVGNMQGYLNFKGYKEFAAENRPDGWNAWVTFVISPAAPAAAVRTPSKLCTNNAKEVGLVFCACTPPERDGADQMLKAVNAALIALSVICASKADAQEQPAPDAIAAATELIMSMRITDGLFVRCRGYCKASNRSSLGVGRRSSANSMLLRQ